DPRAFGLARAGRNAILGGDAETNAAILKRVLRGERGPRRDIVLLNAAPAIIAGKMAEKWDDGIAVAAASIDSGAAWTALQHMIRLSHGS
ncbi:MAG TPA: anthranilate phosphoribosyltransferase, partial [Candidatus Hydrogenedentes bacterium]|nr:anthranilate phosphoribosyltransferase [Candidatus Hydrogenedentota bacterium]